MPAISMFYGIIIYMYFFDNKMHYLPHFMRSIRIEKWGWKFRKEECWKGKYLQINLNWFWHGLRFIKRN